MMLEMASQLARKLVPLGLVVALVIFASMALKARTLWSFRAQLSIFVLIWIAAELPRSLIVAGLVNFSADLSLFGLEAHTVSMVAFGVILVYRFFRLPTGKTQLLKAIDEGLREALGDSPAKAIEFYVEPAIATVSIEGYTRALRRIFKVGSDVIEKRIAAKFCGSIGVEFVEKPGYDLAQYIREAQSKLVA